MARRQGNVVEYPGPQEHMGQLHIAVPQTSSKGVLNALTGEPPQVSAPTLPESLDTTPQPTP